MPLRLFLIIAVILSVGCSSAREAYYNVWEKAGYAKRERLVDNVKAARAEQDAAKTQFTSALDRFKQVVAVKDGDLNKAYNTLKSEYDACAVRAEAVRERIKSVRNVGGALFDEWEGEIDQIKDDDALEKQSQALYDRTYDGYETLLERMDTAAKSMDPVLTKFNNRVIFLKGNLNAQAIGSLAGTEIDLGKEIDELLRQMQASIAEADAFIAKLNNG